MSRHTDAGPLDGLVVLDLSRALAGPHAAMLLGDLGARVIKVENPEGGDDSRGWGPPFVGDGESTYFMSCNRNKESIALDLKAPGDLDVLARLVVRADVVVENFRPGTMRRLGLGNDRLLELNPRLVVLSISGFGHDGPEAGRAGYDQIAQGEAGLMSLTGPAPDDPQRVGVPISDLLAGLYGVTGVLAALAERERTGRGQVVRTSLLAATVGVHAFHGTGWTVAGEIGTARGNHHPSITPYGMFRCLGGHVQLSCGSEGLWRRLCAEFGLDPAAPRRADNATRTRNREEVVSLLEATFADIPPDVLLTRLLAAGIPAGRIRSVAEVYEWEQTRSQGLVAEVAHPTLGTITVPGPALRFFDPLPGGTERETTPAIHSPAPTLGAHDRAIRDWVT
ncbi:MAG: CoA transferase [Pseudonocardia sp.]|uniref:CaiB/BaiF CoA transferase family protein n=1 Tax=unclassified Pseudonocardia TaxID=2619320 RepID=UPI00086D0D6F|nr:MULTISPECIES: CoA transferase [unclassified Pseudonocardia]MBN9113288.1 CoA transferase [Pseudonocardia sp.]ODU26552.1 MAG: CoA-transferase [Pseudonocardia sp. SCN 72-51]ODV01164.1 MAG: CoA-transferase [Pseudonocardia sp. SCN 73-27]